MSRTLIVIVLLILGVPAVAAAPAGKVLYALGEVRAVGADGAVRDLRRGAPVNSGDALHTGRGRLQVRFSDGGSVAMQPDTVFRVDDYHFGGVEDGSERSFLNLVRGSVRFVTGVIGTRNRANYKIRTVVATIGIRGSGGRADMCVEGSCPDRDDGLYLTGNEDVLTLANDKTRSDVRPGDTFFVACLLCDILRVDSGPQAHRDLDPAHPGERFERGAERDREGRLLGLGDSAPGPGGPPPVEPPVVPPPDPVIPLASGTGGASITAIGDNTNFIGGLLGGSLTFSPAGELTQYVDGSIPGNTFTAGTINHFDADGIIAWGLWTSGTATGGYASSLGTSNLVALPYASSLSASATPPGVLATLTGTFAIFGSTPPIAISGGTVAAIGTADSVSGMFNVNFGANSVSYNMNFPLAGETFTLNGTASFVNGGPGDTRFLGGGTIGSSGAACTPSCTGIVPFGPDIQAYITGLNGERIGANYGFSSNIGKITGAVVAKPPTP